MVDGFISFIVISDVDGSQARRPVLSEGSLIHTGAGMGDGELT